MTLRSRLSRHDMREVHRIMDKFKRKRGPCAEFIRSIVFVFCGFLFACQTFLLVNHYFSYPTTINTKLNHSQVATLPAVSLCFPVDEQSLQVLNANELFKKNFLDGNKEAVNIRCRMMTPPMSREGTKTSKTPITCGELSTVVQSINYGQSQKCYTYFSRMADEYDINDFQIRKEKAQSYHGGVGDLVSFEIDFPEAQREHYFEDREATFMLHQANELPNFNGKITKLKPGQDYIISYSKTTEKRMKPPFKPGCQSYNNYASRDSDNKYFIGSKRECINHCIINSYKENCQCLPSNLNIHRDLIYSSDVFCGEMQCNVNEEDIEQCYKTTTCSPSCVEDMFEFNAESTPAVSMTYGMNNNRIGVGVSNVASTAAAIAKAYVLLRKSSVPDVLYEHQPHFEYIEFVFQVLTLACVWLGVSVFTLFWKPIYMVGKVFGKLCCLRSKKTTPLIDLKD
ncbi:Amiloride-sensitive cation channel 5-like protein [Leptotrombidium deliense]|uniref:Amiloride-sensitive cation channel 5-like protein n=1 Tax=Leptotrombidium deliense TaxID=299467 RepID=A0A443SGT4_9ACAR|nr:Amiloride-sensitive cation channel 5-like protein [Leptotrombidium deliense]